MPSGTTHDRITLWTLPWIAGISYGITRNGDLTLLVSGGFLFSGLMFGPDLDIRSVQLKRWGLLRGIWTPYRRLLHHRSLFSHGLIIGTCIRVLYLFIFVTWLSIFVVGIAQLFLGFPWNWQQFVVRQFNSLRHHYQKESLSVFVGLELGALSHSLSDWIDSNRKKRLKKKQLKKQSKIQTKTQTKTR